MTERVLFISPHLDDAVFSCGGLMAMLAERMEVHLLTCFTASVPEPQGFALACQTDKGLPVDVDYMAIRRKEDSLACQVLDAHSHYLPLPEAPHRGYHSAEALFSGIQQDDQVGSELKQNLEEILSQLNPGLILYPVGIGNHVDHQQVIRSVELIRQTSKHISYMQWYDEPYLSKNPELQPPNPVFIGTKSFNKIKNAPGEEVFGLDISLYEQTKIEACATYATQLDFQFGGKENIRNVLLKRFSERSIPMEFFSK